MNPVLDWVIAAFTLTIIHVKAWWAFYVEDDLRMGTFIFSCVVLFIATHLLIDWRRWKRRQRREELKRGSTMPRKMRRKWLFRHAKTGMTEWAEKELANGKITEAEAAAIVRIVHHTFQPQTDLGSKLDVAETKKGKPLSVKERIQHGFDHFRIWLKLYKPVTIPGPPVPDAQRKLLNKPKKRKGHFFSDINPREPA